MPKNLIHQYASDFKFNLAVCYVSFPLINSGWDLVDVSHLNYTGHHQSTLNKDIHVLNGFANRVNCVADIKEFVTHYQI